MDARLLLPASGMWLGGAGALFFGIRTGWFTSFLWCCVLTAGFKYAMARWQQYSVNSSRVNLSSINAVNIVQFFSVGVVLGFLLAISRILPLQSSPMSQAIHTQRVIEVTGITTSDPVVSTRRNQLDWSETSFASVHVRVESLFFDGEAFKVRLPVLLMTSQTQHISAVIPGTRIHCTGLAAQPMAGQPEAAILRIRAPCRLIQPPPRYQSFAWHLRAQLHSALAKADPDAQALVPGLALGDTSQLNAELKTAMQVAGLSHLIAVSGANVSILLAVVLALLHRLTRNRWLVYTTAVLCLAAFIVVVRPQPSVLRASVMGVLTLWAGYRHHRINPLPALCAAVILLLLLDPWLALSFGFTLSVIATFGLIVGLQQVRQWVDRRLWARVPMWLVDVFAVTVCAQCAVFPVLIALGAPLSLVSVPANMIAVPLAGFVMLAGLVLTAVALLSLPIAQVISFVAAVPALAIARTATFAQQCQFLALPWPAGRVGVVCALGVFGLLIHLRLRWGRLQPNVRFTVLGILLALLATVFWPPASPKRIWPPANWVMVQCDVGQGDGAVIRTGKHSGIVIDVGSDNDAMNRCLDVLNIRSIPLMVLTHFHADHVGGVESVVANRQVEKIWVSPLQLPETTTQYVHHILPQTVDRSDDVSANARITVGSVQLECLWPQNGRQINQGSAPNNSSVVLLVRTHGRKILLAADVEQEAQDAIVQTRPDLEADVIKMAHHGSSNQSEDFAAAVSAPLALISVGQDNSYHHPTESAMNLYRRTGSEIWRTDQHGGLALVESESGFVVVPER